MFPDISLQLAPYIIVLSVIGIIYGALVAFVQTDVKKLVAYSSVSHLGFCMLGLFAFTKEAVAGSVLQMLNHGLSTGALFLIVGMIYERRHTRDISQFGGLWKVMPVFTVFFLIATLSSIGLPGLNGFVGEFLILLGAWSSTSSPDVHPLFNQYATVIAATGVVLGAVYMLWMFQRMMQGPLERPENKKLKDLSPREIIVLLPLVLLMFWIGIRPNDTLKYFDLAVNKQVVVPIEQARGADAARRPQRPSAPVIPSMPGATLGVPGAAPALHGPDDGHGHGAAPAAPGAAPAQHGPDDGHGHGAAPGAPALTPAPVAPAPAPAGPAGETHLPATGAPK